MLWLIYSGVAVVAWGLWCWFPKRAAESLAPSAAILVQSAAAALGGLLIWSLARAPAAFDARGVRYALATGLVGSVGSLAFYGAISQPNARFGVVAMLTALYPAVAIVLHWFFDQQRPTALQACGVMIALVGIALMSAPSPAAAPLSGSQP